MAHIEHLEPLPDGYADTRDALHRLASYVLAPARKAVTGRIGLRSTPGGFGTPPFGDDEQLRVEGASLVRRRGGETESVDITSLAAAAAFAGMTLSADPGIGNDPPPLGDPDAPLAVGPAAARALGHWYGFSAAVLEAFRAELNAAGRECSEVQLWPEHFDLGCGIEGVNFGCSPGDGHLPEPYVYVGPWDTARLPDDGFWNASFGAVLPYKELLGAAGGGSRRPGQGDTPCPPGDQREAALSFLRRGARLAG